MKLLLKDRQWLKQTVHVLGHAATAVIGVILAIVGMGLTFSVVFVVAGVVLLGIGSASSSLASGPIHWAPMRQADGGFYCSFFSSQYSVVSFKGCFLAIFTLGLITDY
jgi:hypothetical protein